MKLGFRKWLQFWVLWVTSSVLNFIIVATIRNFYMTDDITSEYFRQISGFIDNWVFLIFGSIAVLLVYLLNGFYKEDIFPRFKFVSGGQCVLFGVLRIVSAPFALKYNAEFNLTIAYVVFAIIAVLLGFYLLKDTKENYTPGLWRLNRKLFRIKEGKFW